MHRDHSAIKVSCALEQAQQLVLNGLNQKSNTLKQADQLVSNFFFKLFKCTQNDMTARLTAIVQIFNGVILTSFSTDGA